MHHADLDFDATTGVRFHPVEILLSLGIKLGHRPSRRAAVSVLAFEVILNATSTFNHGNVRPRLARPRPARFVVTPDMHRVHHSVPPRDEQQLRLQPTLVGLPLEPTAISRRKVTNT